MKSFFDRLDAVVGIENESGTARFLVRLGFVFLILTAVSAPHSIAATQIAAGIGLLCVILRLFVGPRRKGKRRPLVVAMWAFFGWSAISGIFSYEPAVSLDRLRGVSVFLFAIFALAVIRTRRTAYLAAFALIVSCMVNVLMVPIQRLVGRGVEVHGVIPGGPIAKAGLFDGDTMLKVDGRKISTADELIAALQTRDAVKIAFHRPDYYGMAEVRRAELLDGVTAESRLGITSSGPSHYWRVMGFYNHYTTYAEVLQLLMSLVFGLLLASFRKRNTVEDHNVTEPNPIAAFVTRVISSTPFLVFAIAAMSLAMYLTVTRASQLGLMVSAFAIVLVLSSRRVMLAALVIGLPILLAGIFYVQQSRQGGFFDAKDSSAQYRLTMWRDGLRIWTESPRHLVFGVGMDSVQKHWSEWGMYDNGWLPMGHFHSTPIQLLVERGTPALLLWLIILGIYARSLWLGIRAGDRDWRAIGIMAGCLGGMIGFFTGGLVHWNLGDAEVAMAFFLLMGIGVRMSELSADDVRI